VAGENVKVRVERGNIDRQMRRGLRAVNQNGHAARVRQRDDLLDGIDCAERIGNVRDGNKLRFAGRAISRYSSKINSPRSLIGMTLTTAPVCCASNCHGTMFA
jgi:hypothetical protein